MTLTVDLSGKVALITGGTRGMGREIALAYARNGADVIVSSRKADACASVSAEITALGRRSIGIAAHVGHWSDMDRLAQEAWDWGGRVDILVNNAGMSPVAPSSAQTSEELFDKVIGVNFKGPFRLGSLLGQRMFDDDGGAIINVSSIGARSPAPAFGPYAGSKAALNVLTRVLALEFAPRVRVNTLSPGTFMTDIARAWTNKEEMAARVPLRRIGEPSEIVGAALYLASADASYVTGANLEVGGGI